MWALHILKTIARVYYLAASPQRRTGFENRVVDHEQNPSPQNHYLDGSFEGHSVQWANKTSKNAMKADKPEENISKMCYAKYDMKWDDVQFDRRR